MKRRVLSKRTLLRISIVIVLAVLIVGFAKWATSPQTGAVTLNTTSSAQAAVQAPDKTLNGTYITFTYSGKYLDKDEGPSNNELEIHTLSADTTYDKQIIVSVSNLPDGRLSSYGNYLFRKTSPDKYTSRHVIVAGESADMWVRSDGTEQTVFVPHGNKVATISFTTTSAVDQLSSEADTLLSSFHWK